MKTLMIHEVTNSILKLDLNNFDILTFDDCLYSQYLNMHHFLKFKKPIYIFLTATIYNKNTYQNPETKYCAFAHEHAFRGDFQYYMNLYQIYELQKLGINIGMHGYEHKYFENFIDFKSDFDKCLKWFKMMKLPTNAYCFPYNQDFKNPIFRKYLNTKGFETFGTSRIPVESLLK